MQNSFTLTSVLHWDFITAKVETGPLHDKTYGNIQRTVLEIYTSVSLNFLPQKASLFMLLNFDPMNRRQPESFGSIFLRVNMR